MLGGEEDHVEGAWEGEMGGPGKGGMGEQAWVLVLGEVTPMVLHECGMHGGGVVGRWLG
jgi:hypothetical protein